MKTPIVVGLVVLGLSSAARTSHACSNVYFDKNGYSLLAHNMDWVSGEGMLASKNFFSASFSSSYQ